MWIIIASVSVVVVALGLFLWMRHVSSQNLTNSQTTPTPKSPSTQAPSSQTAAPALKPAVYYPITNYQTRASRRLYGQKTTTSDNQGFVCGGRFNGIHDGDDLETTADEANQKVPVFAVADGAVRQVGRVNGYGGLLIIQYDLAGQTITANYGHISLSQTKLKVGDKVTAGQVVSYLGVACSTETDGERKHLHFAIHQGSSIDVAGYVQTQAQLDGWLNPKDLLKQLSATGPVNS